MSAMELHSDELAAYQIRQLGNRIAVARKRRKLRQSDIASRARLSRSTVQAVERGDHTVSIGAVMKVLWALGLSENFDIVCDPALDAGTSLLTYDMGKRRVRVVTREPDNDF